MVTKNAVINRNRSRDHMRSGRGEGDGLRYLHSLRVEGWIGGDQGLRLHVVLPGNRKKCFALFDHVRPWRGFGWQRGDALPARERGEGSTGRLWVIGQALLGRAARRVINSV